MSDPDREREARMYDELYRQLEFARGGLVDEFVAPILREILLVTDRLDRMLEREPSERAVREREPSEPSERERAERAERARADLGSVRDELTEILRRRGVRLVDPGGEPFDPRLHEAVGRTEVYTDEQAGAVVEVRRPGYLLGDRLLRPAQVVVGVRPRPHPAKPDA